MRKSYSVRSFRTCDEIVTAGAGTGRSLATTVEFYLMMLIFVLVPCMSWTMIYLPPSAVELEAVLCSGFVVMQLVERWYGGGAEEKERVPFLRNRTYCMELPKLQSVNRAYFRIEGTNPPSGVGESSSRTEIGFGGSFSHCRARGGPIIQQPARAWLCVRGVEEGVCPAWAFSTR